MPRVGSKHYAYIAKGMAKAKAEAKKTGPARIKHKVTASGKRRK